MRGIAFQNVRAGVHHLRSDFMAEQIIALIRKEDFEAFRRILGKNLPDAYDDWSYLVTDRAHQIARNGHRAISVEVDPDEFAAHSAVKHEAGEYVREGFHHSNTAENYFSILKRGIVGVYHHVSEAHLQRYLAEFDFRYSNRSGLGVDDAMRADRILAAIEGKRLTYRRTREAAHA